MRVPKRDDGFRSKSQLDVAYVRPKTNVVVKLVCSARLDAEGVDLVELLHCYLMKVRYVPDQQSRTWHLTPGSVGDTVLFVAGNEFARQDGGFALDDRGDDAFLELVWEAQKACLRD